MKITISTITVGKSGDSEKNGKPFHWTIHNLTFPELSIFEQNGTPHKFTKASTFDEIAADLKAGDTIEAECEINAKGYLGLKKICKVVLPIEPETKKDNPELPRAGKEPPRSGQEIGMWWKELGDMIRAGKANSDFEKAYCLQMETVLGLRKSPAQPNTPKPADKTTETQRGGKASVPIMDTGMLLNSIKHRLKFTTDKAATQWLLQQNDIPAERVENEPGAVYEEMKEKYHWI